MPFQNALSGSQTAQEYKLYPPALNTPKNALICILRQTRFCVYIPIREKILLPVRRHLARLTLQCPVGFPVCQPQKRHFHFSEFLKSQAALFFSVSIITHEKTPTFFSCVTNYSSYSSYSRKFHPI